VLRYVGGLHIDQGEINGSAFLCRATEPSPSVNWLECFGGTLEQKVDEVRKRARMKYGTTARLARLNVGRTIAYVFENTPNSLVIEFVLDQLKADPERGLPEDLSHALMKGVPKADTPEGELIGDLVANCIIDSFPAK
jgi:hypothetical protein